MKHKILAILAYVAALAFGTPVYAEEAEAAPATALYDFMLGEWEIEASSMLPDGSLLEGSGTMHVYRIHDGKTLQADMRVEFANGTGFIGSTMRTHDPANENWAVSWVPAGAQANAGGVAVGDSDRVVESWQTMQDQFGEHLDTLTLYDITANRFAVTLDRQYIGGPNIEGIWRYVATRHDATGEAEGQQPSTSE